MYLFYDSYNIFIQYTNICTVLLLHYYNRFIIIIIMIHSHLYGLELNNLYNASVRILFTTVQQYTGNIILLGN